MLRRLKHKKRQVNFQGKRLKHQKNDRFYRNYYKELLKPPPPPKKKKKKKKKTAFHWGAGQLHVCPRVAWKEPEDFRSQSSKAAEEPCMALASVESQGGGFMGLGFRGESEGGGKGLWEGL